MLDFTFKHADEDVRIPLTDDQTAGAAFLVAATQKGLAIELLDYNGEVDQSWSARFVDASETLFEMSKVASGGPTHHYADRGEDSVAVFAGPLACFVKKDHKGNYSVAIQSTQTGDYIVSDDILRGDVVDVSAPGSRVDRALDYVVEGVESGGEYPDLIKNAMFEFDLSLDEVDEVRDLYDEQDRVPKMSA